MTEESDQAFERTRSLLDDAIRDQRRDLDLELPGAPSRHFVPVTVVGAVLVFAATLVWAQRAGLGDSSLDETGAEVVASALVFIAVILTESVVVVGLLLAHYSNQRQYRLAVFEQLRLKSDASKAAAQGLIEISRQATDSELGAKRQDAEFERLRHDSAIKAIELLADDDAFGRSGRRCVVINTLIGLGLDDVATSLLIEAWGDPDHPIDSASASISADHLLRRPQLDPVGRSEIIFMLWANREKLFDVTEESESYILYWPDALVKKWPDDLSEADENHLLQCLWQTMWRISSDRIESEVLECRLFEIFSNQRHYSWSGPAKQLWLQLGSVVVNSSHIDDAKSEEARQVFGLVEPDVTGGLLSIETMLTWFRDRQAHTVEGAETSG